MDSVFDIVNPEMLVAVVVCNSVDMVEQPMELVANTTIVSLMVEPDTAMGNQ